MSGMLQAIAGGAAIQGITYKMDDFSINSTSPEGQTSDADILYQTDGVVQERRDLAVGGTQTTVSEASPWSDDPSETGVGWWVRVVSHDTGVNRYYTGGGGPAIGTWVQISTENPAILEWRDGDTSGPYSGVSTYTLALSDDGGSTTFDTCTATITLANEGP